MVNKKGYIKTLEAVIAIIIIFGAILFFLPRNKAPEGKAPYELDVSAKAILEAIQQNPDFRGAVLKDNPDTALINEKIKKSLPSSSPWDYAFSICDKGQDFNSCNENYLGSNILPEGPIPINSVGGRAGFSDRLPDKNIYTKSVFLSFRDITSPNPENGGSDKIIRLYFWEK